MLMVDEGWLLIMVIVVNSNGWADYGILWLIIMVEFDYG